MNDSVQEATTHIPAPKPIQFTYRNHRGEIEVRNVVPDSLEWVKNPGYDYQPGWFISGQDLDKKARRSFALTHIVLTDVKDGIFKLFKFPEVKS